jgi:ribonuclease D
LPLDRIEVLREPEQFAAAAAAMAAERFVGFDTESKPTFTRDAVRNGPHVVQFALADRAYIVQVGTPGAVEFLKAIIESDTIFKVGFGLVSDRGLLRDRFGIRIAGMVEMTEVLKPLRYEQALGVKVAVAVVLNRRMQKSRSVTTSNWSLTELSANQLLYAANDAYAALAVFRAMGSPWEAGPAA